MLLCGANSGILELLSLKEGDKYMNTVKLFRFSGIVYINDMILTNRKNEIFVSSNSSLFVVKINVLKGEICLVKTGEEFLKGK